MRYGGLVLVAMVAGLLFAGCGDDNGHHHEDEDDFIVSHPSSLETFIERESGRAFDVVEVGVTPFTDQFGNPEPYVLEISGIAAADGTEIIFAAEDFVTQEEFFDPLRVAGKMM